MNIGDKVSYFTDYARLWHGQTGPMPATVQAINDDGSLDLSVECGETLPRCVQNVLPESESETHFWYAPIEAAATSDS